MLTVTSPITKARQHFAMAQSNVLPDYIRRAIYGDLTIDEKRRAVDASINNWWQEYYYRKHDGVELIALPCHRHGLLDMLQDAQTDDVCSFMHEVTSVCSAEALAMLSSTSRGYHEFCRVQLHERYKMMAHELSVWLGCSHHQPRYLKIPNTLPRTLRPMLGKWLQSKGRLARVTCVSCRSWVRKGEVIGWIDLESVRSGEPEHMTPEEHFALEKLDTPDGLLKDVLKYTGKRGESFRDRSAIDHDSIEH